MASRGSVIKLLLVMVWVVLCAAGEAGGGIVKRGTWGGEEKIKDQKSNSKIAVSPGDGGFIYTGEMAIDEHAHEDVGMALEGMFTAGEGEAIGEFTAGGGEEKIKDQKSNSKIAVSLGDDVFIYNAEGDSGKNMVKDAGAAADKHAHEDVGMAPEGIVL